MKSPKKKKKGRKIDLSNLKLTWKRTQEKFNKWNMGACYNFHPHRIYALKLLKKVEMLEWKETHQPRTNKSYINTK